MKGNQTPKGKALEKRLQQLDLSDQSQIREAIGQELHHRIFAIPTGSDVDKPDTRRCSMLRNPIPAFILGFVIALAGFSVAHPDTRQALMKLPGFFKVGKSTIFITGGKRVEIASDSFRERSRERIEKGEIFSYGTIYGGYGCGVPEGTDPFLKQTPSLSIAAGLVDRPLVVPTYFHESIEDEFRFRKAEILPNGEAALYFGIGPYETRIFQVPVGENNMVTYGDAKTEINSDGTRTTIYIDPNFEELKVGGKTVYWQIHDAGARRNLGRWAEKHTEKVIGKFVWEDGGVSFALDGRLLTKEEGMKIIESLVPFVAGK